MGAFQCKDAVGNFVDSLTVNNNSNITSPQTISHRISNACTRLLYYIETPNQSKALEKGSEKIQLEVPLGSSTATVHCEIGSTDCIITILGYEPYLNAFLDDEIEFYQDDRHVLGVHRGLWNVAKLIMKKLKFLNNHKKITLIGHSLGGGVAVLLALLLKNCYFRIEKCIIFGTPMVLNREGRRYVEKMEEVFYEIKIKGDLLCSLPNKEEFVPLEDGLYEFDSFDAIDVMEADVIPSDDLEQILASPNHQASNYIKTTVRNMAGSSKRELHLRGISEYYLNTNVNNENEKNTEESKIVATEVKIEEQEQEEKKQNEIEDNEKTKISSNNNLNTEVSTE